jgi:hypothetical protein
VNEPLTLGFGELEQTMSTDGRPTLSVVTASLNQGRYLRDCIESVRAQEEFAVGHLVVDGGSTDETLSILRSSPIGDGLRSQTKASDALNKGFARAKGDWILWLNADDSCCHRRSPLRVKSLPAGPALTSYSGHGRGDGDGTFVRASTFTPVRHRLKRYFVSLPSTGTFSVAPYSTIMASARHKPLDHHGYRTSSRAWTAFRCGSPGRGSVVAFAFTARRQPKRPRSLGGEAAKRWRVHLAATAPRDRQDILPGIPLGGARELWWRCVRSPAHALYA